MAQNEETCIIRLENILKRVGPLEVSILGGNYTQQYGPGYWKHKTPQLTFTAFLAEHPERFSVEDKKVSLSPNYEKARCVVKLERILRSSTGMSMSTLGSVYLALHGFGAWRKSPKQTLSAFLKGYPDKFHIYGDNVSLVNQTSETQSVESLQQLLKDLKDKLAPTMKSPNVIPTMSIPDDESEAWREPQDEVEDEDSETRSMVSFASSTSATAIPSRPPILRDEDFPELSAAVSSTRIKNQAVDQTIRWGSVTKVDGGSPSTMESQLANTVHIRLTDLENPVTSDRPNDLDSPWRADSSPFGASSHLHQSVQMDRQIPITQSGDDADNRREASSLPLNSSKPNEFEECIPKRLEQKRMDFRERIRHCDASVQADMLERLLEMERGKNKELHERIRTREEIIRALQDRVEELEEMLVLEGSLREFDHRR